MSIESGNQIFYFQKVVQKEAFVDHLHSSWPWRHHSYIVWIQVAPTNSLYTFAISRVQKNYGPSDLRTNYCSHTKYLCNVVIIDLLGPVRECCPTSEQSMTSQALYQLLLIFWLDRQVLMCHVCPALPV